LVSVSADGSKLFVFGSAIFASTNSGATWITNNLSISPWSVATSADGTKIMSSANGNSTILSTNSGVSWKTLASVPGSKLAVTADGVKWFCLGYASTNIYYSTNTGKSWKQINGPAVRAISLATCADGTKLVAACGPSSSIYISTNSGSTWLATMTPPTNWFFVASSADGNRLIAAARGSPANGPIYTSTNGGINWTSNSIVNQLWSGIASSADGGLLLACYPDYVFASQTTVSPQLNIASATNALVSWTIPSTNFILQQSSDLLSWSSMTNTPVLNFTNLQNQVTVPLSASNAFFRLITQ
jgi:hypothetical protein